MGGIGNGADIDVADPYRQTIEQPGTERGAGASANESGNLSDDHLDLASQLNPLEIPFLRTEVEQRQCTVG